MEIAMIRKTNPKYNRNFIKKDGKIKPGRRFAKDIEAFYKEVKLWNTYSDCFFFTALVFGMADADSMPLFITTKIIAIITMIGALVAGMAATFDGVE